MASGGDVTRSEVAKGAGLAGLARLGAVIEALAQPLFTWLFGLATYGLYVVLWGVVSFVSNLSDLAMTSALQRVVPAAEREEQAHAAVKLALLVAVLPTLLIAAAVTWQAEAIAGLFSAAPEDRQSLPQAIRIFIWALPLWTFVEVATSAARARRAFGPEIRLRIFWEQIARILFSLLFFAFGARTLGLMLAHLCSLGLTASLCVPLLARYFDLKLLLRAPISRALAANLFLSGLALYPASLARRLLIDAPPVVLNLLLPGTRGAVAAGLFEIARKISTIPLIVRQAFQYVMAPLSSAQARSDRAAIAPLYRFASRVSTALVIPLAGLLIFAGADILSVYRPEAAAALPLLVILAAARAGEAVVGPATSIVEMTGHRGLPLLNSLLGILLWAALTALLVPSLGPLGMAISVAAGTLLIAVAATVELGFSDGLLPFDRKLFAALGIALAGVAMMWTAQILIGGPPRFIAVLLLWALTSWVALRFGLTRTDREALGGFARSVRLVPKSHSR
ncbi:MAG TPA: lipopolysaccharide biosynthesis protein [Allosphingosinicella sp.]|uniref:lipopolysaccharide biosynthesis protein n=1 Tax=Allosphingosinicella sp. TaxID=2823234 RepID=UPI002ED7916B